MEELYLIHCPERRYVGLVFVFVGYAKSSTGTIHLFINFGGKEDKEKSPSLFFFSAVLSEICIVRLKRFRACVGNRKDSFGALFDPRTAVQRSGELLWSCF